jgi:molecular chaperone GrpE
MPSSPGSDPTERPELAAQEPGGQTPPEPGREREVPPDPAAAGGDQNGELAELRARVAELDDRYKRALADLDNYRKRSARETERRVAESREALLRDWLLALDSLERALRMEPPDSPALSGLRAVLEQMEAILERYGVTRVGATGDRFDPERHEAVGVHATADVPDRTVVDVARSGFALGDRVLRPAEVIVARREEART